MNRICPCSAIFLFLLASVLNAAPLGTVTPKTGCIQVVTGIFSCTFFPGHMFPVWFKTADGIPLPHTRFLDFHYDNATQKHYALRRDRWAEQRIIENTPERFVIECKGTCCTEDSAHAVPGNTSVRYIYTFMNNSPQIHIAGHFERQDQSPCTLTFIQPYWFDHPFSIITIDGTTADFTGKPRRTTAKNSLILSTQNCRIGILNHAATAYNNTDDKTYTWIRPIHLENFTGTSYDFTLTLLVECQSVP